MTTRAWWLVVLNILLPGSAQVLAGNRKLGRVGIVATFVLWILALVTLVLFLVARTLVYSIATNIVALTVVQVLLVFYFVLWLVLTVDTLRLARLVRVGPTARWLVAALAALVLVVLGSTANYGVVVAGSTRDAISAIFAGGQAAGAIDGRYNILLLGGDAGADRLGLRPDSISVVSVEESTGKATMIGIPRNLERVPFSEGSPLYEPFPDGYDCGDQCLISYLYTYGSEHPDLYPDAEAEGSNAGVEAMRDAVEGTLGITLQYYVLIDMQGFSDLIDALGGITIDVAEELPIGINGGPVVGTIEAGEQHMDGTTALWYARTRYNMTDYDRMVRQRAVQEAVLAQFEPSNVLTKFQAVAKAGSQVVKSDLPQAALGYFVDLASKTRALPIASVELIPANGVVVERPDFDAIHDLVAKSLAPTAEK
ncbi:LCP family protein required for cell wall assembly [Conyzicola lurida]|uniref:LCP family protein required for cell wall assembly n=1 Tax=Conyzicola lurida TaxID=1172621 RepID=A0A841AS37_9MICO|nr:LCP family protein [Conyzicola lurida]MBB5844239.1 LCP family protein required for cell wall assembly [Conyzicola lurida]